MRKFLAVVVAAAATIGWTKAHYSMSTGLATLAGAYLVGFALLACASRIYRETCVFKLKLR